MTRYKTLISLMLIIVQTPVTVTGCYTYRSLSKGDQNQVYPNNEDAIRLTLKDGSVIESPAFMHVVTKEPTDLFIGTGQERSTPRTFRGILASGEIDSFKTVSTAGGEALVCWLKNRTSIGFKPGEYLKLSRQDTPGLWCMGEKVRPGSATNFRGIVPQDQLADIEVQQLDVLKSAAVVAAPVLLVIVLYEIGHAVVGAADRNLPSGPR